RHKIVVETRMVLVREPDGRQLVIEATHPITERKQLEESLRERAQELTEADRRKNEFVAMLAHELRNPLAPLRNAAFILKNTSPDGAMQEHVRNIMDRQIQNISRM